MMVLRDLNLENNIKNLKPEKVFKFFSEICQIPHGSGNLKGVINYLVKFATERNLNYFVDDANNVIIKKDSEIGEPIILQAHMDMVCVKESTMNIDMAHDPLNIYVDGNYLKAKGTSLGADDGIGVAMILAILDDNDNSYPPIETLFTSDEETGMNGAIGIDGSLFKGKKLINIDSEDEGVLTVSCCGGSHIESEFNIKKLDVNNKNNDNISTGYKIFDVKISGLLGGHSGMEIHKGRANAIVEMTYVLKRLNDEKVDYYLISINGGQFENVICQEVVASIYVNNENVEKMNLILSEINKELKEEYFLTDKNISLTALQKNELTNNFNEEKEVIDNNLKLIDKDYTFNLIEAIISLPTGLIEISQEFNNLPWTSLNHGVIKTESEKIKIITFARSNDDIKKKKLVEKFKIIINKFEGRVIVDGEYPAWQYNKKSNLIAEMKSIYKDLYGKEMKVLATHGGLECGLFIEKIKGLDAVSIGPTIENVHSVDEKLHIDTVSDVYNLLKKVLMKQIQD